MAAKISSYSQQQDPQISSSRLAHLVDILPSGLIIINGNGIVEAANPLAISLLGKP